MRIILVNNYWYLRGGAERVVFYTKEVLEKAGHQVEIFGMRHPRNLFQNKYFCSPVDFETGGFFDRLKNSFKAIYNGEAKSKFAQLVKDFKPDLIHYHNVCHHLSYAILKVGHNSRVPSVMTLHDYKLLSPNYNLFGQGRTDNTILGKKYYRCFLNNCLGSRSSSFVGVVEAYFRTFKKYAQMVNIYISPSNFLADKFFENGFLVNKIKVINNPINTENYLNNLLVTSGDFVLYVGRLVEEKGLKLILLAAQKTPQIKYVIVGDGPLKKELEKIKNIKKLSNVVFTGWLNDVEVKEKLAHCRLFLAPSVWYENYPYSILEAKALGKVVVASQIGGIVEILPDKMLFPPDNLEQMVKKIKYWFEATEPIKKEAGDELRRQVLENNNFEKYYQKLLEIYLLALKQ